MHHTFTPKPQISSSYSLPGCFVCGQPVGARVRPPVPTKRAPDQSATVQLHLPAMLCGAGGCFLSCLTFCPAQVTTDSGFTTPHGPDMCLSLWAGAATFKGVGSAVGVHAPPNPRSAVARFACLLCVGAASASPPLALCSQEKDARDQLAMHS